MTEGHVNIDFMEITEYGICLRTYHRHHSEETVFSKSLCG